MAHPPLVLTPFPGEAMTSGSLRMTEIGNAIKCTWYPEERSYVDFDFTLWERLWMFPANVREFVQRWLPFSRNISQTTDSQLEKGMSM